MDFSYQDITKLFYFLQHDCLMPLDLRWITKDYCLDLDYFLDKAVRLKFLKVLQNFDGSDFINSYEPGKNFERLESFTDDISINLDSVSSFLQEELFSD